jgi:hypothetical protein
MARVICSNVMAHLMVQKVNHLTSRMSVVTLVHPDETFTVTAQHLILQCGLFNDDPSLLTAPYTIRSSVPLPLFQDFVAALEGKPLEINRENVAGLSLLCAEFGFRSLAAELADMPGPPAVTGVVQFAARFECTGARVAFSVRGCCLTRSVCVCCRR